MIDSELLAESIGITMGVKVVIMAGGRGTRISHLFPDIPKPLIPIELENGNRKPVLQLEIESLVSQGFTDIVLTVSYLHEKIEEYFCDGSKFGCKITYFVEKSPFGNAGALFKIRPLLGDKPFFLLNADSMFDVDFRRMLDYHMSRNAKVTLFSHPNNHPFDSGLLVTGLDGQVERWITKEETRPKWYKNTVNAGLHIIDPVVLDKFVEEGSIYPEKIGKEVDGKIYKVDLDRQILKPLCGMGMMYAYCSPEYVKDMGTPERYEQVSEDFSSGIVRNRNLSQPQKAIFLDRDGTINKYVGFLRNIDQFELLPDVAEAIKLINRSGYLAIVVTNQPVIARGEVTIEEMSTIHAKMETLLGLEGAYVDGIYYCPHHPDKGFVGEVEELKIECECRKPKPGMLISAARDYNIDLASSWMIGDGKNDVLAGRSAGTHTVLIKNDQDEKENYGQDTTVSSLLEAIETILTVSKKASE